MRPDRRLVVLAVAGVLGAPVAVHAAAPGGDGVRVSLSSSTPKSGTRVSVDVDGTKLAVPAGTTPAGLALVVQRGFVADTSAVARRCARADAERFACPVSSRIGSGTATAAVSFLTVTRDVVVDIEAFLAAPVRKGDVAGVAVTANVRDFGQRFATTGRIVRAPAPDGLALRFDDIAADAQAPGLTVALKGISLRAGASRTVTVRRTVTRNVKVKRRVRGRDGRVRTRTVTVRRRVKVSRKERRHLIRTPATCGGSWNARAVVALAGGGETVVPVTVPCRSASR